MEESFNLNYFAKIALDEDYFSVSDEHKVSRENIVNFAKLLNARSILDVGCGTGINVDFFLQNGMDARGIDPVQELLDRAILKNSSLKNLLTKGIGEKLPYQDKSFDFVCEFAVLHHVKRPDLVVKEMMRVARKAIFLSDCNRFGQGSLPLRFIKLILYKFKLWPIANFIRTKGKGYRISEMDGLSYSYSVYDNYDLLNHWAKQVISIPTKDIRDKNWLSPALSGGGHVLLVAFKESPK